MKWSLLSILILVIISACTPSGKDTFKALEDKVAASGGDSGEKFKPVTILSASPTTSLMSPVVLVDSISQTFGVTIATGSGAVTFEYKLDDTTVLQSGTSSIFTLDGDDLTSGAHTLVVKASNSSSFDTHTFYLRKNSPTQILTWTPFSLTGNTIDCNSTGITFSGVMTDLDMDNFSISWELDSNPVTNLTPFSTVTTTSPISQFFYSPDCSTTGAHTVTLKVSDGHQISTKMWNLDIANPPVPPDTVAILTWTPTITPVILTAATQETFAVQVNENSGTVNYKFIKDDSTTLYDGPNNFYTLTGSSLSIGPHSLKVIASNGLTSATKIFQVNRNAPPTINPFSPTQLIGETMNCSGSSKTFSATLFDANYDTLTSRWELDGMTVNQSTLYTSYNNTSTSAQLVYTPSCAVAGPHTLTLIVSDGNEEVTKQWVYNVLPPANPPENVTIIGHTPAISPIVLTGTSQATLAVSIADGAGPVTYQFKKNFTTVLQNSSSAFYVLNGSTLSPGTHQIQVRASNAVSYDDHVFEVRRNTPPIIPEAPTPSATGTSINCGTDSITFIAKANDPDQDTITKTWILDGTVVTNDSSYVSILNGDPTSRLTLTPPCSLAGAHTVSVEFFDGYEKTTYSWNMNVNNEPPPPGAVVIQSWSPTSSPIIVTETSSATIAVSVNSNAGAVNYSFLKNFVTVMQNGSNNFLQVNGSSLNGGNNTIRVTATNATGSDYKDFNVRKNRKPTISSFSPALTGTSTNCSESSLTFNANFYDQDEDTLSVKWELDNVEVTNTTPFTTFSKTQTAAQLVLTPDCTFSGSHLLVLTVNDGFETSSLTFSFNVSDPPDPDGAVIISSFIPTINPIVLTNSTDATFAIAIVDGAGAVNYEWKKNSTTIQSGTSPFVVLNGSAFNAGVTNTVTVIATNSVSTATKVFDVRKNTPPVSLTYSPALTGQSVNCGEGVLTFSAVFADVDSDPFSKSWKIDGIPVTNSAKYAITNGTYSSQLVYTPTCSDSGSHIMTMEVDDGYEKASQTWVFNVVNPAVETLTSYFPTSTNITYLSTDLVKTFTASGTGVGALTFKWKLDGVVVQTDSNVGSSNFNLNGTAMSIGSHTLDVTLTDSTTSNDPATPAKQTWTIYRNMKPQIDSFSPITAKRINFNTSQTISVSITDLSDTFTVSITKGALTCTPNASGASSTCGLASITTPTTSGTASAIFTNGTNFVGDNTFTMWITDSYNETTTQTFSITSNYFSNACNTLAAGQICTLVGLPGLGSGTNLQTDAPAVRITPAWMTQDENGNWFFTDHANNIVWFYNASSSTVSLLGQTVPAYTLQVVAGTGITGAGGNGLDATSASLNFGGWGGGLAWDTRDRALFIADYANGRVLRVNSLGKLNIVLGGNTNNSQGALATAHGCSNPVDLAIDNSNRRLYLSCYSSHVIKYIDINDSTYSNWAGYLFAGNGAAGDTGGTINGTSFPFSTSSGQTRVYGPWGLHLDTSDQILYFTQYSTCKVRAIGIPGMSSKTVFGQTITSANSLSISNGSSCTPETLNNDVAVFNKRYQYPMDIALDKTGSTINGMYVSEVSSSRINYCNNSGSSRTIGNQVIAAGMCNNILGNSGSASTIPVSGRNTAISSPIGIFFNSSTIYVADKGYNQIRTMNTSNSNGSVSTYMGGMGRAGYSGNGAIDSKLVTFNNPLTIMYRPGNNVLYVNDLNNATIRSVDMTTGEVADYAGIGSAANDNSINTKTATATGINSARGMAMVGSHFLWADYNSPNCFIRANNTMTTPETIFGITVNANRTAPVIGYYNNCNTFVGTSPLLTNDINAKLTGLYGLAYDSTNRNMFSVSQTQHCIFKTTEAGYIQPILGTCGSAATPTPIYSETSANFLTNLKLNNPTEIVMDPQYSGNFFFIDFSQNATLAHIKYANFTGSNVTINGKIIAANSVDSIYGVTSSPGFIRSIAAYDNYVCFSSGTTSSGQGDNTIRCYNRTSPNTNSFTLFGTAGAGGLPLGTEQEGIAATAATFAAPGGITFDSNGNLYVTEQGSHVVRMIKKWW
jgi:hypothetical protein